MFRHLESERKDESKKDEASQIHCGEDPVSGLKEMFVDLSMGRRIAGGQEPVQRPVFLKPHGAARARFTVRPDLPDDLRVGVFGYEGFDAWVRFSSDTVPTRPDLETTIGMAIKLFDVPGDKLLPPETAADTHDFIFQNHDVFFVDTAKDMCEFTYAGVVAGNYEEYLENHPTTRQILEDMKKKVRSVLDTSYWSVLPYAFGPDRYVKYKLEPCHEPVDASDFSPDDPSYLHAELQARLLGQDACFNFFAQFQTDPESMPLDRATVRWEEAASQPVLLGSGVSASFLGPDAKPTTFANNDGWYDDTSDGPVTAEVSIKGRPIPVDPAWVVVAPPNYAPQVKGGRTMYDLLYDTFVQEGRLPYPSELSFTRDIYPIFRRLSGLQWVNQAYSIQFGPGGRYNFFDPKLMARLANNSKEAAVTELRVQLFNMFRQYERDGRSPIPWPWEYGDAMSVPPADTPRQNLEISPTQYQMLQEWANGDFKADWDPQATPLPGALKDVPLPQRPAMLDRAALTFCLADAFHPGCEMTWPMRHATLYMSPFRIRHRTASDPEPSYGSQLTQEMVLKPDGALYAQSPGTITRWMAVPWQTDTASCRSGYYAGYGPKYDPYVPTFWPARVPNHVLTEEDYGIAVDGSKPPQERVEAFGRRAVWLRGLSKSYLKAIDKMVHEFGKLGVVEVRPGVKDDPYLPAVMMVESKPGFTEDAPLRQGLMLLDVSEQALEDEEAAAKVVGEAVAAVGGEEDEFLVGPIDKVRRFRNLR